MGKKSRTTDGYLEPCLATRPGRAHDPCALQESHKGKHDDKLGRLDSKWKDVALVAPAAEMDAVTFIKHFNARHMPLAQLTQLRTAPLFLDPNEDALRAYHARIHAGLHELVVDQHTHPRDKELAHGTA
jgi:hypothetical protein